MTPLLVLLLCAAEPEAEVRGVGGGPSSRKQPTNAVVRPETLEERKELRFRRGVGTGVLGGFSYYEFSGGPGLTVDAGLVLGDRFSLFVHGELGSFIVTLIGSIGLVGEYALGEQWSVGGGVAFTGWTPLFNIGSARFLGLTFPVRLSYAIERRAALETRRTGLLLSWQIAPGFSLIPQNPFSLPGPQPVQAAITSAVSVGFAWW